MKPASTTSRTPNGANGGGSAADAGIGAGGGGGAGCAAIPEEASSGSCAAAALVAAIEATTTEHRIRFELTIVDVLGPDPFGALREVKQDRFHRGAAFARARASASVVDGRIGSDRVRSSTMHRAETQPGDLVLVSSPGVFHRALCRLAKSPYDHVAVVSSTGDEQEAFVADIERLVDAPYDVTRTLWLIERLLERALTGRARALPSLGRDRPRWICTDAVLLALERHVRVFAGVRDLARDWATIGSGTTNDLLEIHRRRPDLLA